MAVIRKKERITETQTAVNKEKDKFSTPQMESNVLVFVSVQDSQAHLVQSTHGGTMPISSMPHCHHCIYGDRDMAATWHQASPWVSQLV